MLSTSGRSLLARLLPVALAFAACLVALLVSPAPALAYCDGPTLERSVAENAVIILGAVVAEKELPRDPADLLSFDWQELTIRVSRVFKTDDPSVTPGSLVVPRYWYAEWSRVSAKPTVEQVWFLYHSRKSHSLAGDGCGQASVDTTPAALDALAEMIARVPLPRPSTGGNVSK